MLHRLARKKSASAFDLDRDCDIMLCTGAGGLWGKRALRTEPKTRGGHDMKRMRIQPDMNAIPQTLHPLIRGADVYDSSCSLQARVMLIDRGGGYYLKTSAAGTLKTEAEMTAYFHRLGLSAEVIAYESGERDWLLTTRVPGEDCTHGDYLAQPERLCDLLGERLRMLHETDGRGCPVQDRTRGYWEQAERNYRAGGFDDAFSFGEWRFASAQEAWSAARQGAHLLERDALIHGDFCLPNVMLDNWRFSGFIDLGSAGMGDRHIDLFWGMWTLRRNLGTDRYGGRLLDAYGREKIQPDLLRTVAAIESFG